MITIKGHDYPTRVEEMTLKQWSYVSGIVQNGNISGLEKFENLLLTIGVPQGDIDELPLDFSSKLAEAMKSSGEEFELVDKIGHYSLNLDRELSVKLAKFVSKVNELGLGMAGLLAIFYEDERVTTTEHYDIAHVKHKAKIFSDMEARNFVVSIAKITEFLAVKTKETINESK